MSRRSRHSKRSGFVLVVALAALTIVGVLIVGFARLSMNHALDSIEGARRLQSKWGTASCERFAFKHQNALLSEEAWDETTNKIISKPIPRSSCQVKLGGQVFDIRLYDESAKLNVNLFMSEGNRDQLKSMVRKFSGRSELMLSVRPTPEASGWTNEPPIGAWGQIVEFKQDSAQSHGDTISSLGRQLTCWSSTLNVSTASEDIIYETIKVIAGATNAARVRKAKRSEISGLIKNLPLEASKMEWLLRLIDTKSSSQSVWIANDFGGGVDHTLSIRQQRTRTLVRYTTFAW